MNRRTAVFSVLPLLMVLDASFPIPTRAADQARPPNIVLILVDDLGWRDLGCYGSTFYETPQIDALAASGMRFTTAYAAAPVCSPTRASILTGRNPARLGFTGHITSILKYRYPPNGRIVPPQNHMRLRLDEVTLAEALAEEGYVSASIGKWHLGREDHWPTQQGFAVNIAGNTHGSPPSYFDPYINPDKTWAPTLVTMQGRRPGEHLTDRLTDEAIAFIEANQQRPFFLYLSHYAVHTPIQAPEEMTKKYAQKLMTDRSQKNAGYAAMIEGVDQSIGRVLDVLRRRELIENTVVILFSDNGGHSRITNNAPLRGGKQDLYEGGLRVPLIVSCPGLIREGRVCDTPVISHDLFPTAVEYASGKPVSEDGLDGRSLRPILSGDGELPTRSLYWYYPHYARRPGHAVRDGDYKLIVHYDPPSVELFDVAHDLGEAVDRSDQEADRVSAMQGQFDRWLASVGAILHTQNPNHRD